MKKIILTGGGTAGHVTPNLALLPSLKEAGYEIRYIGSYQGMERKLIETAGIPYDGISSGKLRRYFDIKNFSDPFRVVKGYAEARRLLKRHKPDVIFSKGGFVAVPVVLAAKHYKIPVIIHESDMTPGLANKICIPSALKVCCNFPETLKHLPENKAVLTGSPIRQELFSGKKEEGLRLCGFDDSKPVLLVMGGSLGAVAINNAIRENLDELLKQFQIIHLCGRGHYDTSLDGKNGSGKTSLLRLLVGQQIEHRGTVAIGSGMILSYVPQDTSMLNGSLSEFAEANRIDESLFKAILRKMDFSRIQFEKKMQDFSAGQKKKVLIAKSLCEQAHLYVWDEPLNYIDIYSRMQIENLIREFSPTMIFVEHDLAFRNAIATQNIRLTVG